MKMEAMGSGTRNELGGVDRINYFKLWESLPVV